MAAGARLEAHSEGKATPLHLAAHKARAPAVQALVELGASLEARDDDGSTPLDLAQDEPTRQVLVDAGQAQKRRRKKQEKKQGVTEPERPSTATPVVVTEEDRATAARQMAAGVPLSEIIQGVKDRQKGSKDEL